MKKKYEYLTVSMWMFPTAGDANLYFNEMARKGWRLHSALPFIQEERHAISFIWERRVK